VLAQVPACEAYGPPQCFGRSLRILPLDSAAVRKELGYELLGEFVTLDMKTHGVPSLRCCLLYTYSHHRYGLQEATAKKFSEKFLKKSAWPLLNSAEAALY